MEQNLSLHIYNSLGRKKEKFESLEPGRVKMYCCGPTVYGLLHVGNFRGAVFYNFLRNWLVHLGYEVIYVYNFTDVDDKILDRAEQEKCSPQEISERFINEFKKDFASLQLVPHDVNPRATQTIQEMIVLIKKLMDKGAAYEVEGEVFFAVQKFNEYGKLSGRNPSELQSGIRVEVDKKKHDPLDFSLWKPSKEGEDGWESPWGQGRPGWHIECTAMIHKYLGEQIDIHGGGMDLMFPHHENEIAQSEGACGGHYVKYWVHNNMFTFSGQKMSKSLGNIRTMRSFLEQFHPEIFKFIVLSVHYRSLADFSEVTVQKAVTGLARVYSALAIASTYVEGLKGDLKKSKMTEIIEVAEKKIETAMNDDFNTPVAFAQFFDIIRNYNRWVKYGQKANDEVKNMSLALIQFFSRYGEKMSLFRQSATEFLKELDNLLLHQKGIQREQVDRFVEQRNQARSEKDFKKSDELRDQLARMGIDLHDMASGTHWEVQKK